jgi:flagellar export protein FliJ
MRKFRFRLQRVLEYRALQEEWAKEAWLEARALRIAAQQELEKTIQEKRRAECILPTSVEEMQALDLYLERLEDEIEAQEAIVETLRQDEEKCHGEWIEARKNHEALQRLREKAYELWQYESARAEQKALDDWSNARRRKSA